MFEKKVPETPPRPSRRFTDRATGPETVIGQGIRVKGEVTGEANIELRGDFEGQIQVEGLVTVRDTGRLKGDIQATAAVVEGEVTGKIIARHKVELRARCRMVGDIRAQAIAIADGCFFQGKVHMSGGAATGKEAVSFQEKRKAPAS